MNTHNFSSNVLSTEEERGLLNTFWECKTQLANTIAYYLGVTPPYGAWDMALFIAEPCKDDVMQRPCIRLLYDAYTQLRHRLCAANVRLVTHTANDYAHHHMLWDDLVQEGTCGLIQGIDRFDVGKFGNKLATYVTWWIRRALQEAVTRQSYFVTLGIHHLKELGVVQGVMEAHAHTHGRLPDAELAAKSGIGTEKMQKLLAATRERVPLDTVVDKQHNLRLSDTDVVAEDNESSQDEVERAEIVALLMKELDPREKQVVDLRFGLNGGGDECFRQIGAAMNISKARCQQILEVALGKMREAAASIGLDRNVVFA